MVREGQLVLVDLSVMGLTSSRSMANSHSRMIGKVPERRHKLRGQAERNGCATECSWIVNGEQSVFYQRIRKPEPSAPQMGEH